MTTKQKAYIGLGLTSIIWGTTWVASKFGIKQGVPAFELSSIRNGLGGLLLIVFFKEFGKIILSLHYTLMI